MDIFLPMCSRRISRPGGQGNCTMDNQKNCLVLNIFITRMVWKKAAVIFNFCLIGNIRHNFLVPRMIETAPKTFMPIQTPDRVKLNTFIVHALVIVDAPPPILNPRSLHWSAESTYTNWFKSKIESCLSSIENNFNIRSQLTMFSRICSTDYWGSIISRGSDAKNISLTLSKFKQGFSSTFVHRCCFWKSS